MVSTFTPWASAADTGATTQDITVSGHGAVIGLFAQLSFGTADGTSVSNAVMSTGIWDRTRLRCKSFFSENGQVGLTDCYQSNRTGRLLLVLDGAGAVTAYATVAAITDGIRLSWFNSAGTATAPPTAWKIHGAFWGGEALVQIVDAAGPPAVTNGSVTVNTVAFPPEGLIVLGPGAFSTTNSASGANFMLGFATKGPPILNVVMSWDDPDNVVTSAPTMYVSEAVCGVTDPLAAMYVSSFTSNGFVLRNLLQNSGFDAPATSIMCFAMPGTTGLWCGTLDSRTSNGVTNYTAPGIKLQGSIFGMTDVTALDTQATDDTASAVGVSIVGFNAGSVVERFAIGRERDAQATTDTASLTAANVMRMLTGSGTTVFTGNFDGTAWPALGISINFTASNATARKQTWLAFGETASRIPDANHYEQAGLALGQPAPVAY